MGIHAGMFATEYLYGDSAGDVYLKNGDPERDPGALWEISPVGGKFDIVHAGKHLNTHDGDITVQNGRRSVYTCSDRALWQIMLKEEATQPLRPADDPNAGASR